MNELNQSKMLEEFISKVNSALNARVEKALLFGSYAREDLPGSDVDILIVLTEKRQGDQSKVSEIAGEYFLDEEIFLSPKIITEEELEKKKNYSFFKEIREEGVPIYG